MSILQGAAKQKSVRSFYPKTINGSLRFNDDDSAYLSWTPDSAGNRKTWTWSGWVKRGNIKSARIDLFSADGNTATTNMSFGWNSGDQLFFGNWSSDQILVSTQVFRDPSAWYHIVVQFDSTQATASDRVKFYVNGSRLTAVTDNISTYISQNTDYGVNNTSEHNIGQSAYANNFIWDGYLAEVHFTDGTAYDADAFGELKNGVWVAKTPSVTYGTNGFHLSLEPQLPSVSGDYLVVGGGGGAGGYGGAGGGGGFREFTNATIYKGYPYPLTVGVGGSGAPNRNTRASNGGDSVFVITAAGGGGGGSDNANSYVASINDGADGGSGGGSSYAAPRIGGSGNTPSVSPSQGNDGAAGGVETYVYGGAGGGAGGVGGAFTPAGNAGNGGAGQTSSITGVSVGYAGGGGGGVNSTVSGGSATDGGGAGNVLAIGSNGEANKGGGAGAGWSATGASGGSGVVIIKIPDTVTATFSGGVTQTSSTSGGYTVYTVTATSGSETVEFS